MQGALMIKTGLDAKVVNAFKGNVSRDGFGFDNMYGYF
jgi:hypothetical protein